MRGLDRVYYPAPTYWPEWLRERLLRRKHGLSEPAARICAALAFGEGCR